MLGAIAYDTGSVRKQALQCLERSFRAPLLDKTKATVQGHHGKDRNGIDRLTDKYRYRSRHEEDQDQYVDELVQQNPEPRPNTHSL